MEKCWGQGWGVFLLSSPIPSTPRHQQPSLDRSLDSTDQGTALAQSAPIPDSQLTCVVPQPCLAPPHLGCFCLHSLSCSLKGSFWGTALVSQLPFQLPLQPHLWA